MAKKVATPVPQQPDDPTAWILENGFAEFVLMHTNEIVSFLLAVLNKNEDVELSQGYETCIVFSILLFAFRNTW